MFRLIFLLFLCSLSIHAQDTLSGNIGGMVFESSKGPFIVKDNITIEEGKTTAIKAGCVFLFRPFTGIAVNGSLSVEGSPQSPVVFTSCSDNKYASDAKEKATDFDWNGIHISSHAGAVNFSNFTLTYSVYGIKSQKENIVLNTALFNANGQFHFTINDKMQNVTAGIPFNYEKKTAEPIKNITTEKSGFKKALPVLVGATGLATGAAAIVSFIISNNAANDYKNEIDPNKQNSLKRKRTSFQTTGIVLTCISTICIPLSAVLYIRNKNQSEKSLSIYLAPASEPEIGMTIRF
jgi:hypothetical protein